MFTLKNSCVYMNNYPFINNKGQLHLCCKNNKHVLPGNIKTHSLKEMFFSKEYQELRETMLREIKLEGCDICYSQESRNEDSFRIRALTKLKGKKKNLQPFPQIKIQNLDLRVGSTCNLMCTMCHPTDSSKWHANYATFAREVTQKGENHINIINSTNSPNLLDWANHDSSWDNIFSSINDDLNFVYIAGGEPFYIKKFPDYMSRLLDKAPNATVEINTNATRLIEQKYLEKLKGKLQLRISIDGYKSTEEYQRAGTDWENKIKVIEQYSKYFKIIAFDITLTSLTIRSLPDLVKFLENKFPGVPFLFRPVVNREGQHINNLPYQLTIKTLEFCKTLQAKITENPELRWHYNNVNQIINLLEQGYKDEIQVLQRLVKYWDNHTGIKLANIDKELGDWIHADHSS